MRRFTVLWRVNLKTSHVRPLGDFEKIVDDFFKTHIVIAWKIHYSRNHFMHHIAIEWDDPSDKMRLCDIVEKNVQKDNMARDKAYEEEKP